MVKQKKKNVLRTRFTIRDRVYELVPFLKKGESLVTGDTIVKRAKELVANLGQKDGKFILKHHDEIPQEFRGEIYLVFTTWRRPSLPRNVSCLCWGGDCWCQGWVWLGLNWGGSNRLVRRVK